ncbi:MAG: MFS transporter [Gammaproteobacteria bacterium]
MINMPPTGGIPRTIVIGYGMPGFVTAIPVIPIAILLPSFYANDLGLGFTLTGLALGLSRLIDFFSDIIVGMAVDRFKWTTGDNRALIYKPWLIAGGLIAAAGLYALSRPHGFGNPAAGAIYLGAWSCVLFLGWTCIMVPYTAWGAVLASDVHGRSRLTVARESAGLLGMLVALSAPALVLNSSIEPLELITWIAIIAGLPIFAYTVINVPESQAAQSNLKPAPVRLADISDLLAFSPYRHTVICWFLNSLANGLPAVLFPVVAQKYLQFDEKGLFILLFLYFGAGICAAPVWLKMAKHLSKTTAWQIAIMVNIGVFSTVLLIDPNGNGLFSSQAFYIVCTLSGLSLAADMALPASIQADVMESDRRLHGKLRTATAFALWSMSTKLALAAAVVIGFVSLGSMGEGFDPAEAGGKWLLLVLYVCLPIAMKAIVLAMLSKFPHAQLKGAAV